MASEQTPDSPPMTRAERIFMRISILQTVLSVAAVFTGAVALYAALTESEAVRRQSAAAVWPFVQFASTDQVNETGAFFSITFSNAGVGPARIRSVQVELDGKVMKNWAEVVSHLSEENETLPYGQSFILNRVLRPGEQAVLFNTGDPDLVQRMRLLILNPSSRMRYCYCSIFDDCWLADSFAGIQNPKPVARCPDYGAQTFQN